MKSFLGYNVKGLMFFIFLGESMRKRNIFFVIIIVVIIITLLSIFMINKNRSNNSFSVNEVSNNEHLSSTFSLMYAKEKVNLSGFKNTKIKNGSIKLSQTRPAANITEYQIANKKGDYYLITGNTTGVKVIFYNKSGKMISSATLKSIVSFVNKRFSRAKIKALDNHISIVDVSKISSTMTSSSSSSMDKKVASSGLEYSDVSGGWYENKTAMKAVLYYGANNPNAGKMWSQFKDALIGPIPVKVHPSSSNTSSAIVTSDQMGGVNVDWPTLSVSSEEVTKPAADQKITFSNINNDDGYTATTMNDIIKFINSVGGKSVLDNVNCEVSNDN